MEERKKKIKIVGRKGESREKCKRKIDEAGGFEFLKQRRTQQLTKIKVQERDMGIEQKQK